MVYPLVDGSRSDALTAVILSEAGTAESKNLGGGHRWQKPTHPDPSTRSAVRQLVGHTQCLSHSIWTMGVLRVGGGSGIGGLGGRGPTVTSH